MMGEIRLKDGKRIVKELLIEAGKQEFIVNPSSIYPKYIIGIEGDYSTRN